MTESRYTIISDAGKIDLEELGAFVRKQAAGSFFQSPQYYRFYRSLKDYETILICALDRNNRIAGSVICIINRLLPAVKFGFLSRAIVFGGPLIGEDAEDKNGLMDLLLMHLDNAVKKRSVYLEFRNLFDVSSFRSIYEKYGLVFYDHLNFIINTSDRSTVISRMSKSKMQQVKKSQTAGAEIVVATEKKEIEQFYQLVVNLYKNKVKKPFPKFNFFENFFDQREKLGLYIIVKYEGKVIAGMMCPVYENRILYDWFISGEDRTYKNVYPSVMATWGAIDYAVNNQIFSYDFLGAGKPKQEYGVREFKAQFGGDLINNGRYAKIYSKRKYDLSQWVLKRLGYFK